MAARIVVGVDGSPGSIGALRFAVEEARLRGAEVQAVYAWYHPEVYGDWMMVAPVEFDPKQVAAEVLSDAVAQVADVANGVTINHLAAEGPAARVLLEAAEGADLLVVGSRGRGGFTGLLLGSVSQQCVQHAKGPVVVVPAAAS